MVSTSTPGKCPIAFIVFNRPAHTKRVFEAIREHRPTDLFLIADGPRHSNELDDLLCKEVRAIVSKIDWPCRVRRNFSDTNLGTKRRVGSDLDWVFSFVDRAIILEDDCLPHADFFEFCNALLDKYEHDDRVAAITGNNFQKGTIRGPFSYYFSKYPHIWGWATWRRSWERYQPDLPFWESWRNTRGWRLKTPSLVERRYWLKIFDSSFSGEIDSWAYPFHASIWKGGGLTATPNVNLVSNIGFDEHATRTKSDTSWLSDIPSGRIGTIEHPNDIEQDFEADKFVFDHVFGGRAYRFPWIIWTVLVKVGKIVRKSP